jgi:hypothetical protein
VLVFNCLLLCPSSGRWCSASGEPESYSKCFIAVQILPQSISWVILFDAQVSKLSNSAIEDGPVCRKSTTKSAKASATKKEMREILLIELHAGMNLIALHF